MKVLVCGSRSWDDYAKVAERLKELPRDSLIIHGGARGADQIAARVAVRLGLEIDEYQPRWNRAGHYNPQAGFERNLLMLDQWPDLVIAFWDGRSTGTMHTLSAAKKRGIPIEIIGPDEQQQLSLI